MVTSPIPHALAERKDGTYIAGDNKNSWVGVALLQDLFIREHNWVADQIAAEASKEGKVMSDQELFVSNISFLGFSNGHLTPYYCMNTLTMIQFFKLFFDDFIGEISHSHFCACCKDSYC